MSKTSNSQNERIKNAYFFTPNMPSIVTNLTKFLKWLSFQPGYKRSIKRNAI